MTKCLTSDHAAEVHRQWHTSRLAHAVQYIHLKCHCCVQRHACLLRSCWTSATNANLQSVDTCLTAPSVECRRKLHARIRDVVNACRSTAYYIAVFNNNKYLQENASYTLTARWAAKGSLLCPFNCHGHGRCGSVLQAPTCICYPGTFHAVCCCDKQPTSSFSVCAHANELPMSIT